MSGTSIKGGSGYAFAAAVIPPVPPVVRVGRLVVAPGATAITTSDDIVGFDATAGNQTPTIPDITLVRGDQFTITRIATDVSVNTVTITPAGGQTIAGLGTKPILAGATAVLYAAPSGLDWWII